MFPYPARFDVELMVIFWVASSYNTVKDGVVEGGVSAKICNLTHVSPPSGSTPSSLLLSKDFKKIRMTRSLNSKWVPKSPMSTAVPQMVVLPLSVATVT